MQYVRAYQFVFDNPKWTSNVLLPAVCLLIPVIGPIVLLGYQYEFIAELHVSSGQRYPDFTFDRFTKYLVRGIWPFLVQMCAMVPIMFVFMFLWFTMVGMMAVFAEGNNAPAVVPFIFFMMFGLIMLLNIVLTILLLPWLLWAGLAQEFKPGLMWTFFKDFLSRVLNAMLLAQLFNILAGIVIGMVGLLLCCIGMYPAMIVATLGHAHLTWQLYELYLERGGSEIPLKLEEGIQPG
jgi:hypothetical protein